MHISKEGSHFSLVLLSEEYEAPLKELLWCLVSWEGTTPSQAKEWNLETGVHRG